MTTRMRWPHLAAAALALGLGWVATIRSQTAGAPNEEPPARTIVNALGMKFVRVPAGRFIMGSPADEEHRGADETPHPVTIRRPFYLGVHEVTQGQYEKLMGKNPSFFAKTGRGKQRVGEADTSNYPVDNVSWDDATAFCVKLGTLRGARAAGYTYRLPTEAEWEYACRAGTKTATHYGAQMDSGQANFNGLSPYGTMIGGPFYRRTTNVGENRPNAFGLYDMHGNVQEWCSDWYAADYYAKSPEMDPPGPAKGTERVLRGGGWAHSGKACRSAVRNHLAPDRASYSSGFRVVLVVK